MPQAARPFLCGGARAWWGQGLDAHVNQNSARAADLPRCRQTSSIQRQLITGEGVCQQDGRMLGSSALPGGWRAALVALINAIMKRSAALHTASHAAAGAAPTQGVAAAPWRRSAAAPPALPLRPVPSNHITSSSASSGAQHLWGYPVRTAATTAATVAPTAKPCALSATAFSYALDAGSGLPLTWLTHWQQQEAQRAARRALIDATRGRQQERLRQLATLLCSSDDGGRNKAATLLAAANPASAHITGSATIAMVDPGADVLGGSGGSLDLHPLQQMSELDELTWLASHPQEDEVAAAASSGSGMPLWLRQRQRQEQQAQPEQAQLAVLAEDSDGGGSGSSSSSSAAALQGPVQLRVGDDMLAVRPLWIAVYQPEEGGPAKLFESITPLLPYLAGRLTVDISPFCSVTGLAFGDADEVGGDWRNYFVGLVGSVAAAEEDILWPNQVLHRDRVLFNVRNGWDVAKFLAEPLKGDVEEHRDNLVRLAAERHYRKGWCWHMLKLRWGESVLQRLGVEL